MTELPLDSGDARLHAAGDRGNVVPIDAPKAAAGEVRRRLERAGEAAAEAEERAAAAEAEAEELRRRVRELESWLAEAARSDQIEQVQLGRLLALASAEREERRLPPFSVRALLLAFYLSAAVAFVVLVLTARL
jgi:hypothetical protein